jgi:hypothetical protein
LKDLSGVLVAESKKRVKVLLDTLGESFETDIRKEWVSPAA